MASNILNTDVFIVGGGPAGLATAIAVRERGFQALVADGARPPIDKACGEGLMPQTVAAMKSLGIALGPAHAVPFRGIRFLGEGNLAEGTFQQGYGLGIRRTTLHAALVRRAEQVGVEFRWGAHVRALAQGQVQLADCQVQCRWIIGADGQNSRVRKWAGLHCGGPLKTRFGFRQHFQIAPWTDLVEVHWGRHCQIVVTPVTPTEICFVLTSRRSQLRLQEALTEFPELARKLQGHPSVTRNLGAVCGLHIIRRVYRGTCALVGDASGSVDSLTGEGLGLAFQQARSLAEALANNHLADYGAAHRRINRPPEVMSRILLAMENRPWLRRRVIAALAREPHLLERLLAVHAGTFSSLDFGFVNALRLGRRLLANPT